MLEVVYIISPIMYVFTYVYTATHGGMYSLKHTVQDIRMYPHYLPAYIVYVCISVGECIPECATYCSHQVHTVRVTCNQYYLTKFLRNNYWNPTVAEVCRNMIKVDEKTII